MVTQTEFFDLDPSNVDEEDLVVSRSDAVVTATDWTTETILQQLRRGNIELTPKFQRREAWTDSRKSAFIESLFLGLPVPQIVLAERKDQRGAYIVIDGKQRLLSVRRFGAEQDDDDFIPLSLSGLRVRKDLNRMTLSQIRADPARQEDLSAFENQTIRTVVVRNWPDEAFLYLVFLRLNTGSVPLSTQELRQALHPGPFVDFADNYSSESTSLQKALGLSGPDFRMRDVEILIRYFAFHEFMEDYDGNLKSFLDHTCERLNAQWPGREHDLARIAQRCDEAIETTSTIFGDSAFRRWASSRYERPFNRAVFDIMTHYFGNPVIASAAQDRGNEVMRAFEMLCHTDDDFSEALRTTTKSLGATSTRLSKWGAVLRDVLHTEISIPLLIDGRIR